MKAGTYYVGDLCYVMHDCWDEVCDLIFENRKDGGCNDGEFTLKDGRRFAMYSTMYGDGLYPSSVGRNLSVDSGSIGCILLEDIRDPVATPAHMAGLGTIVDFPKDFGTGIDDIGLIVLGHVEVETGDVEEDEEY